MQTLPELALMPQSRAVFHTPTALKRITQILLLLTILTLNRV